MRKKISLVIILLLIATLFIFILVKFYFTNNQKNLCQSTLGETKSLSIENTGYCLLVADTLEEREKGLMWYTKKPDGIDGMVFIFPDKQNRIFWNKNTLVDLTVYWMDDEKLVGQSDLPSINKTKDIMTISSPKPANIVVEIIK